MTAAEHDPTDPADRFKGDLLALFVSARDLLCDDAYAAVLPHLEALRLVLPNPVAVPALRAVRAVEEVDPWAVL